MNRFLGQAEEENSKNKIREKGTICLLFEYINPHTYHDPMIQTVRNDQLTIPEQQIFNLVLGFRYIYTYIPLAATTTHTY